MVSGMSSGKTEKRIVTPLTIIMQLSLFSLPSSCSGVVTNVISAGLPSQICASEGKVAKMMGGQRGGGWSDGGDVQISFTLF